MAAFYRVKKGETTWEQLIAQGQALPRKVKGRYVWQAGLPTEVGYYWHQSASAGVVTPVIVEVTRGDDGLLYAATLWGRVFHGPRLLSELGGEWFGPMQPPPK